LNGLPRVVDEHASGGLTDAHELGDFCIRQLFEVSQDQGESLSVGESDNKLENFVTEIGLLDVAVRVVGRRVSVRLPEAIVSGSATDALANDVMTLSDNDRAEPGPHSRAILELVEVASGLEEGILDGVFGISQVPAQPVRQADKLAAARLELGETRGRRHGALDRVDDLLVSHGLVP
jgi:hypothetical protein